MRRRANYSTVIYILYTHARTRTVYATVSNLLRLVARYYIVITVYNK